MSFKFFSHTRLDKYNECSEYYRLYYIDKSVPRPDTDRFSTTVGSICHDILETYGNNIRNFQLQWQRQPQPHEVPSVQQLAAEHWHTLLAKDNLAHLLPTLNMSAQVLANLKLRASASYQGPDAIRKSGKFKGAEAWKNDIATAPEKTAAWTNAYAAAGIEQQEEYANNMAKQAHAALPIVPLPDDDPAAVKSLIPKVGIWAKFSLTKVYADVMSIINIFTDHVWGCRIDGVEFQISEYDDEFKRLRNAVYFPGTDVIYKGYIDLAVTDSYNRVYLIDYKSSKEAPTQSKVAHWEQLLLYGWAWKQIHGQYPHMIAIWHLRTNQFIWAPFDPVKAEQAVARKMKAIKAIEQEVFIQQNPTDFSSNCVNKLTKEPCPYLEHCHPEFAVAYALEREEAAAARR
jgi:hypothetical protein